MIRPTARSTRPRSAATLLLVALALLVPAFVAPTPAGAAPDRVAVLIRFDERPTARDLAAVERSGGRIAHRYGIVPAVAATVPEGAVEALRARARVAAVEADLPLRALDYRATHDWGIAHVDADDVHTAEASITGAGTAVAVVDSGVDCDHAELVGARCVYGEDYVSPGTAPDDDWGHGTHVAGTVAAQRDTGVEEGVVGVAPSATVLAYKVLDDNGHGSLSDVVAAVDDVWNGGGTPKAHVVNMSLGWGSGSTTVREAMDRAYAAGIVLVAAAGNGGNCGGKRNSVSYPARYDSVVAVAAVDRDDTRPCWSSTGDQVELAAPGVSVFSTWPSDLATSYRDPQPVCELSVCHYKYGSGTSMAAPHVAGAAALVIASATVGDGNGANGVADEVRRRLADTAVPVGRASEYGHGVIDVHAATRAADAGEEPVAGGDITLTVSGYKHRGDKHVDLSWSGATTTVDIWRDGGKIAAGDENDGAEHDHPPKGSGNTHVYRVCEAGTENCSNEAAISL